jgi:RNase P protein component
LRLTGVYFDLTDRFKPASAAQRRQPNAQPAQTAQMVQAARSSTTAQTAQAPVGARKADRPEVLISVAKRLVPSAVQRNTVKRIVRESWRTAVRNAVSMKAQGEQSLICLVRLKRCPVIESTGREATAPAKPSARGRVGTPRARRSLRADIDSLFAVLLSGAGGAQGGSGAVTQRSGRRRTAPTVQRQAASPES